MNDICKLFKHNGFKANKGKVHFLQILVKPLIKSINEEVFVAVTIDNWLTFKEHVTKNCFKSNQKLDVLIRTTKFIILSLYLNLVKSFLSSQFNHFPIVSTCFSRGLNNKINHIHERALRRVYRDFKSDLKVLLPKDKTIINH